MIQFLTSNTFRHALSRCRFNLRFGVTEHIRCYHPSLQGWPHFIVQDEAYVGSHTAHPTSAGRLFNSTASLPLVKLGPGVDSDESNATGTTLDTSAAETELRNFTVTDVLDSCPREFYHRSIILVRPPEMESNTAPAEVVPTRRESARPYSYPYAAGCVIKVCQIWPTRAVLRMRRLD